MKYLIPTLLIFLGIIIYIFAPSRMERRAQKLYELYLIQDSIRFEQYYINSSEEAIALFNKYLEQDAESERQLNNENIIKENKRKQAKKYFN